MSAIVDREHLHESISVGILTAGHVCGGAIILAVVLDLIQLNLGISFGPVTALITLLCLVAAGGFALLVLAGIGFLSLIPYHAALVVQPHLGSSQSPTEQVIERYADGEIPDAELDDEIEDAVETEYN